MGRQWYWQQTKFKQRHTRSIDDHEIAIRKRRLRFNGYMFGMDLLSLNKQIFDKIYNLRSQGEYNKQINEDLRRIGITDVDCQDN